MGIRLSATSNINDVLAKLDAFASGVSAVAMPRALNKLIGQAQVAGLRAINAEYKIGPRAFERYARIEYVRGTLLEASIAVRGSGLPLQLFNARRIGREGVRGGGVRVTLKGRTFLIPHAFIKTMRSGHVGVFARGAYGGKGRQTFTGEKFGRFQFGRQRFSINELFTFAPPGAFSNPIVTEAMNERMRQQSGKVIQQEIRFAARG